MGSFVWDCVQSWLPQVMLKFLWFYQLVTVIAYNSDVLRQASKYFQTVTCLKAYQFKIFSLVPWFQAP